MKQRTYVNADMALQKIWSISHLEGEFLVYSPNEAVATAFILDARKFSPPYQLITSTSEKNLRKSSRIKEILALVILNGNYQEITDIIKEVEKGHIIHFIIAHHHILFKNWRFRGKVNIFNSFQIPSFFSIYEHPDERIVDLHHRHASDSEQSSVFPSNSKILQLLAPITFQPTKNLIKAKRTVSPSKRI